MPILTLYSWLVQENPLNMFDLICFVMDLQIFSGPFILTSSISEVSYMISTVDRFECKSMLLLYVREAFLKFGCLQRHLVYFHIFCFSVFWGKNVQTWEMTKSMLIYSLSSQQLMYMYFDQAYKMESRCSKSDLPWALLIYNWIIL
jgi:hypothetical protein